MQALSRARDHAKSLVNAPTCAHRAGARPETEWRMPESRPQTGDLLARTSTSGSAQRAGRAKRAARDSFAGRGHRIHDAGRDWPLARFSLSGSIQGQLVRFEIQAIGLRILPA